MKRIKKIEALTEQLNWYSQQIKLQQKKLFGSSSEKTVLPDQISLFDTVKDDDIITEIRDMDLGNMTPLEALNTIYRLIQEELN